MNKNQSDFINFYFFLAVPVDWTEINAAWGLSTLLLHTLSKSLHHNFAEWEPIAHGTASRMRNKADGSVYELSGYGELSLGKLFWYRKFDTAILGFVACVAELVNLVTNNDPSFLFPYNISKDKIGEIVPFFSSVFLVCLFFMSAFRCR